MDRLGLSFAGGALWRRQTSVFLTGSLETYLINVQPNGTPKDCLLGGCIDRNLPPPEPDCLALLSSSEARNIVHLLLVGPI